MSSVDNFCTHFGPRSGPTWCRAWSGSKLFDTLMVFLKKVILKKISNAKFNFNPSLAVTVYSSPEPKAPSELIGWDSSRCQCVRLWVHPSIHMPTLSNLNISETSWPIKIKFHMEHHWGRELAAFGFWPDRFRTPVSMATVCFNRVIMGPSFLNGSSSLLQVTRTTIRGFIKRREAGIFPFYSGMFPLLLLINLYRVYRQILSNHPPTLPWYPDAKKVNETPEL